MAFESWNDVWAFVKRQIPDLFTKRKVNFITIHYLYIMGMSFFLSAMVRAAGPMAYIDALFFAAGACTQSGLNTIDVNTLRLGQQICFYIGAMLCNPIIIHSSVVFVRLYWFERRFKDIVRDARSLRRSKSRTKTMELDPDDPERVRRELGVRGRAIQVLRHTGRSFRRDEKSEHEEDESMPKVKVDEGSDSEPKRSDSTNAPQDFDHDDEPYRDIDEVRIPAQLSPEQHIQFLERQRNPEDTSTLRIPSPREFDRGGKPENVDDVGFGGLPRRVTTNFEAEGGRAGPGHITIDEPQIHRNRTHTTTFPRAGSRQRTNTDLGADHLSPRKRTNTGLSSFRRSNTGHSVQEPMPYLSWQPTVGRNSFFVNLSEDQREELGGIEYRALKTLAWILVAFFFGFHILGIICLVPWIMTTRFGAIPTDVGQGRPWWGIFTAGSAFNDLGFTLTPDSMISFQYAVFPLLLMTFLIIIGNTGFPCMLRFVIWACSAVVPAGSGIWEELQFLLDHPRRCFTLLFPRGATWWLFGILVILNGVDLILFIILDLNDETVASIPVGYRILDGLFQAASTRTAGFSVVNIANLHPAIQVSYLIMMYISVFPIAISMRRTNVYEEKSLGIYAATEDDDEEGKEPSYVGAHVRRQLSFDLWYIFLGLFIIAIVEGHNIENTNEYAFTMFSVLFEIVSAYGTVGLSLGYPDINASFSAKFATVSKLVIIAMMIRGRHRGLPYELDRAVLLPSEKLHEKESREGKRLMQRRMSFGSMQNVPTNMAVSGALEGNFRAETGLSSGADHQQRFEGTGLEARIAANHTKKARIGLGQAMYKLTSVADSMAPNEDLKRNDHNDDEKEQKAG
jgi:Trk-type K+ transport system membrane component